MTTKVILSFLFLLLASSSLLPPSSAQCHSSDKKALLQIQADFKYPPALASWNTPAAGPCCNWTGIDCLGTNRVMDLYLYYSNLPSPISPAIGRLSKLQTFRADGNAFTGPIPAFFANLKYLDYLHLGDNLLSGPIPAYLANLPLTLLQLNGNHLTGPIPDAIAAASINYLYLYNNSLSGSLPASFSKGRFDNIDISYNQFSGDASPLFGASRSTQEINLSNNGFQFDLSGVEFPVNLTRLHMSHNKIYGSIPTQITQLKHLQSLDVSYNQLCGQIPVGGKIQRFRAHDFYHNKCLCGAPLPACS